MSVYICHLKLSSTANIPPQETTKFYSVLPQSYVGSRAIHFLLSLQPYLHIYCIQPHSVSPTLVAPVFWIWDYFLIGISDTIMGFIQFRIIDFFQLSPSLIWTGSNTCLLPSHTEVASNLSFYLEVFISDIPLSAPEMIYCKNKNSSIKPCSLHVLSVLQELLPSSQTSSQGQIIQSVAIGEVCI